MNNIENNDELYQKFLSFIEWVIAVFSINEKPYRITISTTDHTKIYIYFKSLEVFFEVDEKNSNIEVPEEYSDLVSSSKFDSEKGCLEITLNSQLDAFEVVKHKNPQNYFYLKPISEKTHLKEDKSQDLLKAMAGQQKRPAEWVSVVFQIALLDLASKGVLDAWKTVIAQYIIFLSQFKPETYKNVQLMFQPMRDGEISTDPEDIKQCKELMIPAVNENLPAVPGFDVSTNVVEVVQHAEHQLMVIPNVETKTLEFNEVDDISKLVSPAYQAEAEVETDDSKQADVNQSGKKTEAKTMVENGVKLAGAIEDAQQVRDNIKTLFNKAIDDSMIKDFPEAKPQNLEEFNKTSVAEFFSHHDIDFSALDIGKDQSTLKRFSSWVKESYFNFGKHLKEDDAPSTEVAVSNGNEVSTQDGKNLPAEADSKEVGPKIEVKNLDKMVEVLNKGDWLKTQISETVLETIAAKIKIDVDDYRNRFGKQVRHLATSAASFITTLASKGAQVLDANDKAKEYSDIKISDPVKDVVPWTLYCLNSLGLKEEFGKILDTLSDSEANPWREVMENSDPDIWRAELGKTKDWLLQSKADSYSAKTTSTEGEEKANKSAEATKAYQDAKKNKVMRDAIKASKVEAKKEN